MANTEQRSWRFPLIFLLITFAVIYLMQDLLKTPSERPVAYSDLIAAVRAGQVAEVRFTEQELIGVLKEEAAKAQGGEQAIVATRLPGIDETALLKELDEHQVKYSGEKITGGWWSTLLIWLLPFIIILLLINLGLRGIRQGASGVLDFGKTRAKIYDQSSKLNVTFDDVAGLDEAKAELVEIVDFLKKPSKYQALGGRIPKGVLIVGPPGTGKTLLAKAVSGEAGVPFFSISGSAFVEMFVGVGAARVRDLFEQAKQQAPCIIFIDELDAIGKSRAGGYRLLGGHEEREQTLNQLLAEIDGFDSSKGVIIMAATNTPEVLDPALLRAGRFDRQVVLDSPDLRGREAILRVHAKNVKLAADVELKTIAARTPGMVGADLANIINEAALLAARRSASAVESRDLEEAIDRVLLGLEKKSRVMDEDEKRRVAYHETGHALIALTIKPADYVHRISIIPRSIGALGHTLQLPTQEKYLMTKTEIIDRIAIILGGRVAEEIIYTGETSTGAADDLERASELARQMVRRFGMSSLLGPITFGQSLGGKYLPVPLTAEERNYSEHTAKQIDEEVSRIVKECYSRVKTILTNRRPDLERIAAELIRKETLERTEIEGLLTTSSSATAA